MATSLFSAAGLPKAFGIRFTGICRKANTLFKMFNPKILVLVDPGSGDPIQGYLSKEWPEVDGLLESIRVSPGSLLNPNNFDTVAEREANTPKSGRSSVSSALSSELTSVPSEAATQTFDDLFCPGDEQLRRFMATLEEPGMPPPPHADMAPAPLPVATPAFIPRPPTPVPREDRQAATIIKRKRKAASQSGPPRKRQSWGRVVTRSQDRNQMP
jgi:hypothetical protein